MPLFMNLFVDGGCLLEEQAAGDQSIELQLDEQDEKVLNALLALESFPLARMLGAVFMAGVLAQGGISHRPSAGHPTS